MGEFTSRISVGLTHIGTFIAAFKYTTAFWLLAEKLLNVLPDEARSSL